MFQRLATAERLHDVSEVEVVPSEQDQVKLNGYALVAVERVRLSGSKDCDASSSSGWFVCAPRLFPSCSGKQQKYQHKVKRTRKRQRTM